jgi:hypothetical protein
MQRPDAPEADMLVAVTARDTEAATTGAADRSMTLAMATMATPAPVSAFLMSAV